MIHSGIRMHSLVNFSKPSTTLTTLATLPLSYMQPKNAFPDPLKNTYFTCSIVKSGCITRGLLHQKLRRRTFCNPDLPKSLSSLSLLPEQSGFMSIIFNSILDVFSVSLATLQNKAGEKSGWTSKDPTTFKAPHLHVLSEVVNNGKCILPGRCAKAVLAAGLFKVASTFFFCSECKAASGAWRSQSPSVASAFPALLEETQFSCTCHLLSLWPSLWLKSNALKGL